MDTSLWVFSSHPLDTTHAYEHRPGAASMPTPYRRRQPEATVLHELVQSHRSQLLRHASEHSEHGYPAFIEHTFERYLECGLLEHGFARVRCEQCGFDRLVAFSCKARGLCPSCSTRRMHDVAAHLADRVLPWVPHRQWVASFPRYVRYQLARDPELLGNVLRGFLHIVFSWQRRRARKQGISDGRCGAITFIQRFGGFVNLNVHFHALVPDGVFVRDTHGTDGERQRPRFIALDPPTDDEIVSLTTRLMRRVARILARHHDENADDDQQMDALAQAQAASVQTTFLPSQTRLHRSELDRAATRPTAQRSAFIAGYSLHANVRIHKNDRESLERLCRYGLRPAFALERLSWTPNGQIEYQFKRPAPSGATRMICAPVDFLAKLTTLIPPPRKHLTRYHGVFAPNHPWRPDIVPSAPPDSGAPGKGSQDSSPPADPAQQQDRIPATVLARRLDWAALMLRVFAIDVLQCPRCTGRMRVIALITEPTVIRRVLDHVSMFEDSRAPPAPHADGIDHR